MLPFSEVSLLAVVVGTIASMILGMIWYGPLFGKSWMQLVGIKMDKKKPEGMCMSMVYGLINTFVMIYVIALVLAITNPVTLQQALTYGAMLWLGFSATTKAADSIWARKPLQLFWIDASYTLVAIVTSVLILMNWPA